MAKRSSAANRRSREVKQFMAKRRDQRHRQQDEQYRQLGEEGSAIHSSSETLTPGRVFSFDTPQQSDLQHLIALIRCHQEDDLGQFFGAALTTTRRFSQANIDAIRTLLATEVQKIEMEEFFGDV